MTTPCRAISPHSPSIARVLFSRSSMRFWPWLCRPNPSAGWGDFGSSPMYPTGVGGWEDKSPLRFKFGRCLLHLQPEMAEPPANALTPLSITNKTNKFVLTHPPFACLLAVGCFLACLRACCLAGCPPFLPCWLAGWLAGWLSLACLLACLPACLLVWPFKT